MLVPSRHPTQESTWVRSTRLFSHQISSHPSRSSTMCKGFGYSIVLQWLLHRPQRQHCTALVAPRARAVGRATNKMGSEPAHLASGRATIAPSTRHWAQQLVVTITLGRAVVRVAPASTTTHPGRSTRLDWPPCLYCRPKAVFAQNINICSLSDLRLNSPPPSAKKHIETRYFYQTW